MTDRHTPALLCAYRNLPHNGGELEVYTVPGSPELLSLVFNVRSFSAPVTVFLQRAHLAGLLQLFADVLNAPQHSPRIWWPSGD